MPILFVMVLVAICLPVPWPRPPFGFTPLGAVLLSTAILLVPILGAVGLSVWMVRRLKRYPLRRGEWIRQHQRYRRVLGLLNLVTVAVIIAGCGWGWTVWNTVTMTFGLRDAVLVPGGELLVPLPYFLLVILGWFTGYPVERALTEGSSGLSDADGSRHPATNPPPTLVDYLSFHLRQFALLVMLPLTIFAGQQSLIRTAPELAADPRFQLAAVAAAVALILVLPRLVKPLLGLKALPPGSKRDRLEQTCRRLGFRYRELLLWPTRGAMANAMVLGLVPWARYVVFTDRLLHGLEPEELDTVLGHEIGHIAHGHILSYAIFFVLSAITGTLLFVILEQSLAGTRIDSFIQSVGGWMHLPPILGMTAYLFVVFGWLSRRCERQADLYGCRAGSCGTPDCRGHETALGGAGGRICRCGVRAMIHALERVMILNGMDRISSGDRPKQSRRKRWWAMLRAWQHGPLSDRMAFLQQLLDDPALADRTDRRIAWQRALVLAALAGLIAGLGTWLGWAEVWRLL